ncbi:MAG: tRNA (N6-threonylcarbamoyladenosine(37)-N6)-methyltransferase TrmO [Anaerolineaceae bacterium]|nr:tRNA (N6-threonylcarbamoyladenosine(37)-N6)-methyltransferase TrmO [Anaerolineaceae bacterium]
MIELSTSYVRLIALSKQQLFELVYATEKLEQSLSFLISHSLVHDRLRRSVGIKLNQMKKFEKTGQGWLTYWLLQKLESPFGAGLLEFNGIPDTSGRVEIRYDIHPDGQDQGWLSDAIQALSGWALQQPECGLVTATSNVDSSSIEVFEKAGFIRMAQSSEGCLWHKFREISQIPHPISKHGFESIGSIHTSYEVASGTPIQPNAAQNSIGTIIIDPALKDGLKDLEGFSHIILLYVFDRITQPRLTVKPFMDDQDRGVFATRAPARPNPIGISVVRLLKIEGNQITFAGVDMLNNTPLLDIKPYVPQFEPQTVERIGWLEQRAERLQESRDDGRFLAN